MFRRHALVPLIALVAPLGAVVAVSSPASAVTLCDGKVPTILAAPGVPTVGTPGDDVILGTDGDDIIDGGAGNDTICGLDGRDTLIGGLGDDRLFGGLDGEFIAEDSYRGDLIIPGPGDDYIDLGDDPRSANGSSDGEDLYDRVSFRDATGPVSVDLSTGIATGEGTDTIVVPSYSGGIVGSAFDDVLIGSNVRDTILGGGGDDTIKGGDGDDFIEPDRVGGTTAYDNSQETAPGNDTVDAGTGDDLIVSHLGRDRINGGAGDDGISGYGRGSDLRGGKGKDFIRAAKWVNVHGGNGNDEIEAVLPKSGRSTVDGGAGYDIVRLDAKSDFKPGSRWLVDVPRKKVMANASKRMVWSGVEDLRLESKRSRLTYLGGPGRDVLMVTGAVRVTAYGRGGNDTLSGGKFNDFLDGGPGRDNLNGGNGRDRCINGENVRQCEVRR
jgi:Ca2+-binding RTX toxin-like protein